MEEQQINNIEVQDGTTMTMDHRQRTINNGPSTMDPRPWTIDHGPLTMGIFNVTSIDHAGDKIEI